uniref:Uncharacterized protein n=1 Tax=Cacopsylla melanoneura TaxID=428564 RepID=A0A8D8M2A6_9HEMI
MKRNACGHAVGRSRTSRARLRSCLVVASVCRLRNANHGILEPSASGSSAGRRCRRFRVAAASSISVGEFIPERDPIRGPRQAGSSTGAVHLSKNNAGVLRSAQRGQKPRSEQKGKSRLDLDVQHA